jgi:DNA-binding MarR family transcriptional regulator
VTTVENLPSLELRRLRRVLETIVDELGVNTTLRQVIALCIIAQANKAGRELGVRDIDREMGDLPDGSASKFLRSMMHVETERKAGIANTVRAERDQNDLRSWNLHLTPKAIEALEAVLDAAAGR